MLNPKQLLIQEAAKEKVLQKEREEAAALEHFSQDLKEVEGKQGFLWREMNNTFGINGSESQQRVWITFVGNKLLFSEPITSNISANAFIASSTDRSCLGFIVITPKTIVQQKYATKTTAIGANSSRKYGFEIIEKQNTSSDSPVTSIIFYTEEEEERKIWMDLIEDCKKGNYMILSHSVLNIPLFANRYAPYTQSFAKSNVQQIEFPKKEGYLRKTTVGHTTFGMKKIQKRYFVLVDGEFSYYEEEEDYKKASKVRDMMDLDGAKLLESNFKEAHVILLQLLQGRTLRLEANDVIIAEEWKHVIKETLQLLELRNSRVNQSFLPTKDFANKTRRYNLHEYISKEELIVRQQANLAAAQAIAQANSSPMSFFTRRTSINNNNNNNNHNVSSNAIPLPPPSSSSSSSGLSSPSRNQRTNSISSMLLTTPANKSLSLSSASMDATNNTSGNSVKHPLPAGSPTTTTSLNGAIITTPTTNANNTTTNGIYKTPQVIELLKAAFAQHFLFKPFISNNNNNINTEHTTTHSHNNNTNLLPVLDLLQEKYTTAGEVILWQGGYGDLFYILEQGICEVIKDHVVIGNVTIGNSFGEMALINSAVRQATIRCLIPCKLWTLHRHDFRELIHLQTIRNLSDRINFLKQIDLFHDFVDSSLEKIAEVMHIKHYLTNEKIIKQGDYGDLFYMILAGRVSVTQSVGIAATTVTELVKLGPGKYFGEKALLENAPRKATVTATTNVTCYTIDRQHFINLFGSLQDAKQENLGLKMLKNVKILESLNERQLMSVAKCLVNQTFVEGDTIIKQGDIGDSFFMLISGEVSVQVNHIQVAVLSIGAFFGEMSLLSNDRRSATIIALKDTTCFVLNRNDFNELLGPLEEIITNEAQKRQQVMIYNERRNSTWSKWFSSSTNNITNSTNSTINSTSSTSPSSTSMKRNTTTNSSTNIMQPNPAALFYPHTIYATTNHLFLLSGIEKVKKISYGTFGTIYLVHQTSTGKSYAMKQIAKEYLYQTNQEKVIASERDIALILSGTSIVCELYATLQDNKCIYYISHYYAYGDLWQLLYSRELMKTKYGGISLPQLVFYAANVLTMIHIMHEHDIVYRDLKPENLMISSTGYLKLIDYGSAKVLKHGDRTSTICGTPEYLPPEMVLSREYNRAVDYWSLGIFLYELLTRNTPFVHSNLIKMYQAITEPEVHLTSLWSSLPFGLDNSIKQLINRLLVENSASRLGMHYNGIQDVWDMALFAKPSTHVNNNTVITLEKVTKCQLIPPFIPSDDDENNQQHKNIDTLEFIDMLEDDDEVPEYTGDFDYSEF